MKSINIKSLCKNKITVFTAVAAAAVVLLNVILFGVCGLADVFGTVNADVLSGIIFRLCVLLPVLLSFFTARHLNGKKEFISAALCGAASLLVILLFNLLSMVAVINVWYPMAVVFSQAYLFSFLSMTACCLAVYAACLLAAALYNGVFKRVFLIILLLFLPTAIALMVQLPEYGSLLKPSYADGGSFYVNAASSGSLFSFPSFYSFGGKNLSVSALISGPVGLTNIWNIVYNYILVILFAVVGYIVASFEIKLDKKEICTDLLCVLLMVPVFFASLVAGGEGLLFPICAVLLFLVVLLLLRGKAQRILHGAVSLAICAVVAGVAFAGLNMVKSSTQEFVAYPVSELESVSFEVVNPYYCCTSPSNEKTYSVEISDTAALLSVLKTNPAVSSSRRGTMPYNDMQITLVAKDGKHYTTTVDLQTEAARSLYGYIDENTDASLFGISSPVISARTCLTDGSVFADDASSLVVETDSGTTPSFEVLERQHDSNSEFAASLLRFCLGYETYAPQTIPASVTAMYRYVDGQYYVEYASPLSGKAVD